MSTLDQSSGCDECGRLMTKAKRVHAAKRYCATCYARLFKRGLCKSCGNFSRLPVFDPQAECSRCVSVRPCVRCARVGRPVGKLTNYGPACNSCAHYFNAPRPCEKCSVLSTRLVSIQVDDCTLRCCPRCARCNEQTCPQCHRYRKLVLQAGGRAICRQCMLTSGSRCTECHCEIPGGRGKECENCYWSRTFQKRLLLDANALGAQAVVDDFLAFGAWLAAKGGNQRAALSIHRHFDFFAMIDAQWAGMPSAEQLLEHIGCEGLRWARAPIRWYKLAKQFVISDELLELHVEHGRVRNILSGMLFGADRALLDDYLTTLQHRVSMGRLRLASLRGRLNAAAHLLLLARSDGASVLEQRHVDRLLKIKPGIAGNLWGFVTFCNARQAGRPLIAIDKQKTQAARRSRLEAQMIKLAIAANRGRDVERTWISRSLAYFHRLSSAQAKTAMPNPDPAGNGWLVDVDGITYWVPDPRHLSLIQEVSVSEN